MDVISYAKAQAVDKRLTDAIAAGNNPSGWMTERDAINAKLSDASKISQTLINGTSVINGTLDSPVSVEVQGRTLVSMGQSVLQNGKQFLLADKKTKIRTLGSKTAQTQGVAKFVQNIPTSSTAKFTGKIAGSVVENPHKLGYIINSTVLAAPSSYLDEGNQVRINSYTTQDGNVDGQNATSNGGIGQRLFSFNIIEEVERQLGRIPGITTADKVAWLKTNVSQVVCKWYGYGSGPAGNKATLAHWQGSTWQYDTVYHVNGTVSMLSITMTQQPSNPTWAIALPNNIMSDGFMHFLAYADASDGVTTSTITTDYVELAITLGSSAQLDNRPILTRVANFEGKVIGSYVENPHDVKHGYNTALINPSATGSYVAQTQPNINAIQTLNGSSGLYTPTTTVANNIAQTLLTFDIIQEIERNLGRIPKATLADKVQWVKDNVLSVNVDWYGFGSGPAGYKSYLKPWYVSDSSWHDWGIYTPSSSVTKLTAVLTNFVATLDNNGFVNLLAHADAAGLVANPTVAPTLSASGSGSGLAAGTYYVVYTWNSANGETLVSPENSITITAGQNINITIPAIPFGVQYGKIYMGTTSGTETAQATTTVTTYTRVSALTAGSAIPTTNTAMVASIISTDYVELQIELKQQAVLHDPVVPLYQIDDTTEYNNILTTWLEAEVLNRYPKVQGVEHLQNVYAIAEGENLLPNFYDPSVTFDVSGAGNSYTINGPYDLTIVANNTWSMGVKYTSLYLKAGQPYTFSFTGTTKGGDIYRPDGSLLVTNVGLAPAGYTFTPDVSGLHTIKVKNQTITETYSITNPMLTLGSTAKPFTPRNPSYLFATNKLGQIGTVKDMLYKSDGQWYVRKAIEKDVVLDGSLAWVYYSTSYTTGKRLGISSGAPNVPTTLASTQAKITKYDGKIVERLSGVDAPDRWYIDGGNPFFITVDNADSGYGSSYSPNVQEVQAYFYGWQAKTVDANGKPTAWRSLGDGTDAPTQTLAYVSVNKAPNFTPYKLTYQLTTPVVQQTTVEGDIALNGPTQIEVGSGVIVREKVVPYKNGTTEYWINNGSANLSKKLDKFIGIYKNGINDMSKWSIRSDNNPNGKYRGVAAVADVDTTAEYTVTYLVYSVDNTKAAFTNPPLEFKATYDTTLKSVVDHVVEKQADLMTITSVNVQAIAELYKRVKALGG